MKAKINELKVGQWLESSCGIYEVVETYDSFHGWVTVREVCFTEDEGDDYVLGDESRLTKGDLTYYEAI